jgi:hypothetical protein
MKFQGWAIVLLAALAAPAAAQISIQIPGTGGAIQINPGPNQQYPNQPYPDQRYPDQNRYYGGGVSIRVLGAVYGRNCRAQYGGNVTNDIASQCQGRNYCVYNIDYRRIGDPAPGCAKDYYVRYQCRDGDGERWASAGPEASGRQVALDCRNYQSRF